MKRRTESLLWSASFACLLFATVAVQAGAPEPMPRRTSPGAAAEYDVVPAESLGARVMRVVANDPFRMARVPSALPFGAIAALAPAPVAGSQLPNLQLRGIVGPPWHAVLEGAPGTELGQLVRVGDSIAGARVVSVRVDAVTLRTTDTTWTLLMRRP